MAYAIIETGGKQLWVEPGLYYDLNTIKANPGDDVLFERVLLIKNNDELLVGTPCVKQAKIHATILRHIRGKKVLVYKMKPKKGTRRKQGHRQNMTRVMVNSIHVNDTVIKK